MEAQVLRLSQGRDESAVSGTRSGSLHPILRPRDPPVSHLAWPGYWTLGLLERGSPHSSQTLGTWLLLPDRGAAEPFSPFYGQAAQG